MLPLLIVAICRTLPDFPMINARYDDEGGHRAPATGTVNLGMASADRCRTDGPRHPRRGQDRNVWQLASEISRLAEAARTGKAKSERNVGIAR